VFSPALHEFSANESHQGKDCFVEGAAFALNESINHWRTEIVDAFGAGKTIFIFLASLHEFLIDTGERTYSGTGRNRTTIRQVTPTSNYQMVPVKLESIRNAEGRKFSSAKNSPILDPFTKAFSDQIEYLVHFAEGENYQPLLLTSDRSRVIAASLRGKRGNCFLLPFLRIDWNDLLILSKAGAPRWNAEALKSSGQLVDALVAIDKSCGIDVTPPPSWTGDAQFRLHNETSIETSILETDSKIEKLKDERGKFADELRKYISLRDLLFEKGTKLEAAVRLALLEIGFEVGTFADGDSEFDIIFSCGPNRYLGEVEGKDGSAIDVAKISQLERNVQEEFQKADDDDARIGVLFGNAFRLTDPRGRGDAFTAKVLSTAKRTGSRLVKTQDLFTVAQYLRSTKDEPFAEECRTALLKQVGQVVSFPAPPTTGPSQISSEVGS